MKKKQILVPIDFSSQSETALQYATAFAKDFDAELLIVHVMNLESPRGKGLESDDAMVGLPAALHALKPSDETIGCSHELLQGSPADAILAAAERQNVEMIVMGTHGRSGLKRLVMGSVAEAVVRAARCPVLTLREATGSPDTAATDSQTT